MCQMSLLLTLMLTMQTLPTLYSGYCNLDVGMCLCCRHELSAAEVTRRLQAQSQKQQRQQRHSPAAKRMLPQQKHSQQQQQQGSQDASVSQTSVSKLLPPGVQFVTVTWITSCLRARQRCASALVVDNQGSSIENSAYQPPRVPYQQLRG